MTFSSGVRAAREKPLAVSRPIASGRDGLHVMQLDRDAVQDISWPGLRSSGGGLKIKEIEGGRHSLPHRGHEAAEWRRF